MTDLKFRQKLSLSYHKDLILRIKELHERASLHRLESKASHQCPYS
jgi:hypothetical protein